MAYAPPPPPPMKRPYPGEWNSPARPPKEPRPPGTDEFYAGGNPTWGSGYPRDYGYYGWGNSDYEPRYEPENYGDSGTNSNNINVDFTDDYAAFYGKGIQLKTSYLPKGQCNVPYVDSENPRTVYRS